MALWVRYRCQTLNGTGPGATWSWIVAISMAASPPAHPQTSSQGFCDPGVHDGWGQVDCPSDLVVVHVL